MTTIAPESTEAIKKGTVLTVQHVRKGTFTGIAMRDFVPANETFYPIALAQEKAIKGMSHNKALEQGEEVPCRNSLCTIKIKTDA